MVFTWYDHGIRIPTPPEAVTAQRRAEQLQRVARGRRSAEAETGEERAPPAREQPAHRVAQQAYQRARKRPREPALHAHQIMTSPVISLAPEASVDEAWALIRDRRFRHVPVVSHNNKLVGVLSDRDLLREAAGIGNTTAPTADASHPRMTVRDLIAVQVLTASPDTEIRQIARVLFEERLGAIPIVDDDGNLVGIVTRSDILRTLIKHAPLELWV